MIEVVSRELRRGQRQGEEDKKHVSCKLCGALFTVLSIEVLPFLTKWQQLLIVDDYFIVLFCNF